MSPRRLNDLYGDFKSALRRLNLALVEDIKKGDIVVDGTIQRFEFTFELSWKLMKAVLERNGIQAGTPRDAIKESYQAGIIENGQSWIKMLESRNQTSHIYNKSKARVIYRKIKKDYKKLFTVLEKNIKAFMK
ncbi:MAG: nucleotidyltransferase substrate binding protein [Candidatus Omnitrophota bacterium]|nr:nucleotidyltransferase substrate binding protein [Candidatus Omnitrophota bacterium]